MRRAILNGFGAARIDGRDEIGGGDIRLDFGNRRRPIGFLGTPLSIPRQKLQSVRTMRCRVKQRGAHRLRAASYNLRQRSDDRCKTVAKRQCVRQRAVYGVRWPHAVAIYMDERGGA